MPSAAPPTPDPDPAPLGQPISRRRFLRRTIAGAALIAVGGTLARNLSGYPAADAPAGLRALSAKEAIVLGAIARRMVAPDERGAPSTDEMDAVRAADEYVAGLPEDLSSDLKALLHLVEHAPIVLSLRPSRFTRLDAAAQDAVLDGWATSRLAVRRQGFTALKSLVMLAYYGDPRSFSIPGWPGPLLPTGPT